MGFHTFDPEEADRLETPTRFRFCSREELIQQLPENSDAELLDAGSGTGFYTDELAPFFETIYALDLQPAMHARYRERGVPENVRLVTANLASLPYPDDRFDGAVSTMTFHESGTPDSVSELYRVLAPDAPLVIVDWSSEGRGEAGPPLSERYNLTEAAERLTDVGFTISVAAERTESFLLRAD